MPAPTDLSRYQQTVKAIVERTLRSLDRAIDLPGAEVHDSALTEMGTFRLTIRLEPNSPVRGTEWDR